MWSVGTILTGLYSFMLETAPTLGSVETSLNKKRQLAATSLEYNVLKDPTFCKLFPEYVERYQEEKKDRLSRAAANGTSVTSDQLAPQAANPRVEMQGVFATVAGVVAILSIVMAVRFL